MFCHKCGAQIAEGAAFCQKCGAKVIPAEGELHPTPQATDEQGKSSLIEILGTPTSEGYYDDPDAFDTYYMLYEGFYGESNLIIDLYDDTAVWLYIGDYEI